MPKFLIRAVASLALLVFAIGAAIIYGMSLLQPVDATSSAPVRFSIPKGQSVTEIGERLAEAGLVHNAQVFALYVRQHGLVNKIQAGSFELSPSMSLPEIAEQLTSGTDDVWITFIEGSRAEELAEKVAASPDLTDIDQDEFLALAQKSQGYLFPDTYLVPKMTTAQALHDLMRATFKSKVEVGLAEEIKQSGRSLEDIITLASLVQREARTKEDMRTVAGILWNRIDKNVSLDIDVTLRYIKGYDPVGQSWWSAPLADYKNIESPYNTYRNPGLPPGPIGNPGLAAIEATVDPIDSDYVFYLHDTTGQIHYAETLSEHNANVQKYLR